MDSQAATGAVAAVIDAHTPTGYEGNVTCWCGPNFDSWAEHSVHVAAAVLAALGLTEETATIPNVVNRVECTCGIGTAPNEDMHSCGFTRGRFTFTPSRRLVGPWQVHP